MDSILLLPSADFIRRAVSSSIPSAEVRKISVKRLSAYQQENLWASLQAFNIVKLNNLGLSCAKLKV